MPHDGRVESDLPKLTARVRVRRDKNIHVGLDKHPHGQLASAQQDLSSRLVLPVK